MIQQIYIYIYKVNEIWTVPKSKLIFMHPKIRLPLGLLQLNDLEIMFPSFYQSLVTFDIL